MEKADIDAKAIGAVALIGIGVFISWSAYQRVRIKDYWEAIGRAVVGVGLIYGGVWLFGTKEEEAKEETKEEVKEKITAAIADVE